MNYFKRVFKTFGNSFKELKAKFLYAVLIDGVLFAAIGLLLPALQKIVERESLKIGQSPLSALAAGPEAAQEVLNLTKPYFAKIILWFILAVIIGIIIYSILRGSLFSNLHGKKYSFPFAKNYLYLNLWWIFSWIGLFLLLVWIIAKDAYTIMIVLWLAVMMHTTSALNHNFSQHTSWKKAVSYSFGTFKKFHKFIFPYLLAVIVFIIWAQVWRLINIQAFAVGTLLLFVIILSPFRGINP